MAKTILPTTHVAIVGERADQAAGQGHWSVYRLEPEPDATWRLILARTLSAIEPDFKDLIRLPAPGGELRVDRAKLNRRTIDEVKRKIDRVIAATNSAYKKQIAGA